MTITTKTAKNGVMMYYVDGKRISRDKAIEISKNADVDMLTNAFGANIELKDAQAILVIATKDPLEVGKYREFGWCFTNVVDAVEAAKKVATLFGDRFIRAYVMSDAEHDNRIIATVDKAGNVKIKKQTPTYIFTDYQIIRGINPDGRTEHIETFATYCRELGDDDNFTGLYRAVTYYEEDDSSAWDIKTADGKLIAKGNTKAELQAAFENIKTGNVEVGEEIAEVNAGEEIADITDAETAEVIPVERFWCEVEIAELSEQDAADIVAHFHGQDGANKFFKMRATELDGTEEDIDGDNVFDYLPTLDELNDVDIDDDDDNTPPADEPMSDDISDICKYKPDIEDDNKPVRLDWDDSAIAAEDESEKIFTDPAAYDAAVEAAFKEAYPEGCELEPAIVDNGKTPADMYTDEYIITQEAIDEAIEAEEFEAFCAEMDAKILADPIIDAAYRKAKERVEVTFTKYGYPQYRYRKTSGEWTDNKRVAKAYISKCGLSELRFIVKAKHEAKFTLDRRTEKIGSDEVYYIGGKWQCTYSAKYHASFFRGIRSGELMYRIDDLKIVSEQEFWAAMIERGACTIDLTDAEELTAKLKEVTRKADYMSVSTQSGEELISRFGTAEVHRDGEGFIFTTWHETLARYDTKEQCEFVIDWIKKTVADVGNEFEFPTAELVALEMHAYELLLRYLKANYRYIGRHYWQMRIGDKWRNAPRRFMAADLKYYGLTPAQLKEAYHAAD